ncbi:hypothetical protein AAH994_14325 [Weeksellaceae bacterium A-14]
MANLIEQYIEQSLPKDSSFFQKSNELSDRSNTEYNKNHIFHSVLDFISKNNSENKMDYMTLFYTYEKLLDHSRMRDYNICEYYVDKINFLHKNIQFDSNLSIQGMYSLYNPAIGYYYYSIKKFDKSLKHMLDSIQNINELIQYGFVDATFIKIEQYLNLFRLCYDFQYTDEAIKYATSVVNYILGSGDLLFKEYPIRKVIRNEAQYNEIISIFFNAIIFKALRHHSNIYGIFKDDTLKVFFSKLSYQYENTIIFESLELLKNIYNEEIEFDNFCGTIIQKNILVNPEIPSSIRFLFLKFISININLSEVTKDIMIKYEDDILLKNEKHRILFLKNTHKNIV